MAESQNPQLELACNCRYSMQSMTDRMAGLVVGTVAGQVGNWVGGTLCCFERQMVFSARRSIRIFKKTAAPLTIEYENINEVWINSIMFLAKTVDVETISGVVRFRAWGENNQRLRDFLQAKIARPPE